MLPGAVPRGQGDCFASHAELEVHVQVAVGGKATEAGLVVSPNQPEVPWRNDRASGHLPFERHRERVGEAKAGISQTKNTIARLLALAP